MLQSEIINRQNFKKVSTTTTPHDNIGTDDNDFGNTRLIEYTWNMKLYAGK